MKFTTILAQSALLLAACMLSGCPFGSKNDDPQPKGTEGKQQIDVLKLDWDSVTVNLEQTSRTVDDKANVLLISSADACWGCQDYFYFAIIDQEQCGRNGWQCSARGNIEVRFEQMNIGKESSLGWQVQTGGKLTIYSTDGSVFLSGITETKNYQIKKIEIQSFNDALSRNNGDIRIGTPECPGANQNQLFVNRDAGDEKKLIMDLAAKMNNSKYALAIKVTDLNRWCASSQYKPEFLTLRGEKFSLDPPKSLTTGKGELIGQDLADLLIADVENIFDYSQGSTYFWMADEVNIITANDTIQYYKRGKGNGSQNLKYPVSKLQYHFEDNDSIFVMIEGYESFEGTWKFADKNKFDRIIIHGHDKGRGYGYNNVELAIDKLEKNIFNYTREIDFTNYDPYEINPYSLEKDFWIFVVEDLHLPFPTKFKAQFKMVPYR